MTEGLCLHCYNYRDATVTPPKGGRPVPQPLHYRYIAVTLPSLYRHTPQGGHRSRRRVCASTVTLTATLPSHCRYITVTLPLHLPLHYRHTSQGGGPVPPTVQCDHVASSRFGHVASTRPPPARRYVALEAGANASFIRARCSGCEWVEPTWLPSYHPLGSMVPQLAPCACPTWSERPPWQHGRCRSPPAVPPQGAAGGPAQLGTPRARPSHRPPRHRLGGSSEPPAESPLSPRLTK